MSTKITVFPSHSRGEPDEHRSETERLAAWSTDLIAMQSEVSRASDFGSVMKTVLASALRLMPSADGAAVCLLQGDEIEVREAIGTLWPRRGIRLSVKSSLSGQCLRSNEPLRIDDAATDPRIDRARHDMLKARSLLIVPVPFLGRPAGVLVFISKIRNAFRESDKLTAQILAGPLSIGFTAASRSQVDRQLTTEARRFAATFEQAAVGIAHVAPDGRFLLINDRFCEIAGHSREDLLKGGFQKITHPDDLDADLAHVEDLLAGRAATYSMEKRYIRSDREIVWINLTGSLVRDDNNEPEFFVAVIEDITNRKKAEVDATHDSLTGLVNRRGIEKRMQSVLGDTQRAELPMAVVYMDLDGFKAINDIFGHAEGDRCLVKVARALQKSVRAEDTLGRLGGDEFVALMPRREEEPAVSMIQGMRDAVLDVARGEPWTIAFSAGAAILPTETRVGAAEAIAAADRLMYRAKQSPEDWLLVEKLRPQSEMPGD